MNTARYERATLQHASHLRSNYKIKAATEAAAIHLHHSLLLFLVSSIVTMALANLVGVQRAAAGSHERPDAGAFLATRQATDRCAAERGAGHRQLVTMLLPETPVTTMIANARDSLRECCSRQCKFESS